MSSLTDMSPADLVRKLTKDELQGLQEHVIAGRIETAVKALHERGAGASLVEEQYMGRYPLELIQNANDAAAAAGRSDSRVKFVVTPEALVVADEGSGFGARQILAICGLASSSKSAVDSIGYKGLGFKSVNEITNTPQIISGDVRFYFDELELRQRIAKITGTPLPSGNFVPAYATPFILDRKHLGYDAGLVDQLLSDGYKTVLRLPIKSSLDSELVSQLIARVIQPELLLYMTAIGSISVSGTASDFTASIRREVHGDTEVVTLWRNEEPVNYILVRTVFPIENFASGGGLGRGWENVTHARVAAAVRLDGDGAPTAYDNNPLSVYFPTEETTGTSILINGDFQVELDRRRLAHKGAPGTLNQYLAEAVAQFLSGRFLDVLVERLGSTPALFAFTRTGESVGFGRTIVDRLHEGLRGRRIIPCVDGRLRKPGEALLEPTRVPSVETAHKLLAEQPELAALEVATNQRLAEFLTSELGVSRVGLHLALRNVNPTQLGVAEFYEFIHSWSRTENITFRSYLKDCKCVHLGDDSWVRPSERGCYLPSAETSREPFNRVNLPLAHLPEGQSDKEIARNVLQQAGLEPFTPRGFVIDESIPKLGNHNLDPTDRLFHMSVLHAYFDRYIRRQADSTLGEPLKNVLLPARDHSSSTKGLRRASTLYIGIDIDPDNSPELIYGNLGQVEYFDASIDLGVDNSSDFLDWMGVSRLPRLTHVPESTSEYPGWKNSAEYLAARSCTSGGHPRSQRLTAAPTLDRLPQLLAKRSEPVMSALWNSLVFNWSHYERTLLNATWYCSASQHKPRERTRTLVSPAIWMLTRTPWIPVQTDDGVSFLKPDQLWSTGSSIPPSVIKYLPQLPARFENAPRSMENAFSMRDASDIGPEELVEILRHLPGTQGSSDADRRSRVDASKWVIETMRRLTDLSEIVAAEPPLPARQKDEIFYTPCPYFTAHPSNEEAWGDQIAFLAGDATDFALAERLQLPVLESLISTRVETDDRNTAAEAVADQIWKDVSVEALALVARSLPSKLEELALQFSRLSFKCVSHLAVVHSLPGHETVREEGVDAFVSTDLEAFMRTVDGHLSWSPFSLRLAEAIGAVIGDSLAVLLLTGASDREKHLRAHGVLDRHIDQARSAMDDARQLLALETSELRENQLDSTAHDKPMSDSFPGALQGSASSLSPNTDTATDDFASGSAIESKEVPVNSGGSSAPGPDAPSAGPPAGPGIERDPLTRIASTSRGAATTGGPRGGPSSDEAHGKSRPQGASYPSPAPRGDAADSFGVKESRTPAQDSSPAPGQSDCTETSPQGPTNRTPHPRRHGPENENESGHPTQPRQSRWMSYVVPQDSQEARHLLDEERRARELGDLGALAVMRYERAHGRFPELMEHHNKGFDVISRDAIGDVVRYIEVKATAGQWSHRGVAVSSSQVDYNRHLGDLFWLYVVENTEPNGSENIYTIRNPAAYIDYYMFDANWRALSHE